MSPSLHRSKSLLIIVYLGLLSAALIVVSVIPFHVYAFEIIKKHWPDLLLLCILGLGTLPFAKVRFSKVIAAIIFLAAMLPLKIILPFYLGHPAPSIGEGVRLKLAWIDLAGSIDWPLSTQKLEQVDLLGLLGVNNESLKQIEKIKAFPYQQVIGECALISRYPWVATDQRIDLGDFVDKLIMQQVNIEGRSPINVAFVCQSLVDNIRDYKQTDLVKRRLSVWSRHSNSSQIVMGRLGVTPYSGLYQGLKKRGKLNDGFFGLGMPENGEVLFLGHNSTTESLVSTDRLRIVTVALTSNSIEPS